ncbi:hypothetical protein [Pseudomonas saudiphocaensis]|uniref:Deoxynucleoside kinase n=1 Tax=Pseudomonas saudiphocaensis TaxID=1499686 RepID=A0A078LXJ1_9PSED|nr:hypothetical protein [Pseudomonas saudiphocaensis]CDZ94626.1 hypothetical protein BN1079_01950 [Pseudomonas saudiphocaensis]
MRLIELYGPAGSGKTTLKYRLAKKMYIPQEFVVSYRFSFLLPLLMLFCRFAPKQTIKVYSKLSRHKEDVRTFVGSVSYSRYVSALEYFSPRSIYLKQRIILGRKAFYGFSLARRLKSDQCVIFDEGPAQRATSLYYAGVPVKTIEDYLNEAPIPDKLVVLNIERDELHRRLSLRNGVGNIFSDDIDGVLMLTEKVIQIYRDRGCPVTVVDDQLDDYWLDI